jgi:ribosomal protein S7
MQQEFPKQTKKAVVKKNSNQTTKLEFSSYPTPGIQAGKTGKANKGRLRLSETKGSKSRKTSSPEKTAGSTSVGPGGKLVNSPSQPWPMSRLKPSRSFQKSPKNIYQNWISWLVEKQDSFHHKKPDKLQKLVHHLIREGKKTRALKLVRQSFHYLRVYKKNFQTSFSAQSKTKALAKASSLTSSLTPSQKEGTSASKKNTSAKGAAPSPSLPSKLQAKRLTAGKNGTPSPFPKRSKEVINKILEQILKDSRFPTKKSEKACASSLSIFKLALQKVRPFFHLRKARKAGVNIQVPAILPPQNQDSLAIQWLIEGAKVRKKKDNCQSFAYHLAQEILVAAFRSKESYAFQKREEGAKQVQTHRNAARFRWW